MHTYFHHKTQVRMFTVELAYKSQKLELKCPSVGEWTNKLLYFCAMKRNGNLTHTATWMNLRNTLSRESIPKQYIHMIPFI